jgi:hypothetical protein
MADAINCAETLAVSCSSNGIGRATLDREHHRALTRYEAARRALAEARRVDEIKGIRDRAAALAEYARQAKDTQLLKDATEIRFRAERRGGELLAAMPKAKEAEGNPGGRGAPIVRSPVETAQSPTLAELGITKTQSSRWQKLAALPDEKFEIRIAHAQARVEGMTTSAPSYPNADYTGENEWFTPADWIERARRALGETDSIPPRTRSPSKRCAPSVSSPPRRLRVTPPASLSQTTEWTRLRDALLANAWVPGFVMYLHEEGEL